MVGYWLHHPMNRVQKQTWGVMVCGLRWHRHRSWPSWLPDTAWLAVLRLMVLLMMLGVLGLLQKWQAEELHAAVAHLELQRWAWHEAGQKDH